jgi:ATP-dependent Lhr-like helicase
MRRLEARGELRGGRVVAGFVGEQFALPAAVEGLRGLRSQAPAEALILATRDPIVFVEQAVLRLPTASATMPRAQSAL